MTTVAGMSRCMLELNKGWGQLCHEAGKVSLEEKETQVEVWNLNWRK